MSPESEKIFGSQLKGLRQRLGLRQDQFAGSLGVHKTTISRLERGIRNPPLVPEFYQRLGEIEGVTPSDVGGLLHAGGPLWAFQQVVRPRAILTPLPGVILPLYLDPKEVDDEALEILKTELTGLVRDFYRIRMERAERLGQFP